MRRVEVQHHFNHPIETVFRRYTNHVRWSEWAGLGRVRIVREGSSDTNGVGCVRAFALAPRLREEVTCFEPPLRMEYRITQGAFPLADHHGEVLFASQGTGTGVTWRVSFASRIPGLGWLLERALTRLFRKILGGLVRDLEERPDVPGTGD